MTSLCLRFIVDFFQLLKDTERVVWKIGGAGGPWEGGGDQSLKRGSLSIMTHRFPPSPSPLSHNNPYFMCMCK